MRSGMNLLFLVRGEVHMWEFERRKEAGAPRGRRKKKRGGKSNFHGGKIT